MSAPGKHKAPLLIQEGLSVSEGGGYRKAGFRKGGYRKGGYRKASGDGYRKRRSLRAK
jgi:hypothetical protein